MKTSDKKYCPDCETEVKLSNELNTDRHGNLKYYKCKSCKQEWVSIDNGELELSANHN